jgi:uncharacterized protein
LRLDDEASAAKPERGPRRDRPERGNRKGGNQTPDRNADRGAERRGTRDAARKERSAAPPNSAMADALRRAGLTGK